jgi:hypothetical protein
VSFVRTGIVCGVLYAPVDTSLTALGDVGGAIVGVTRADAHDAGGAIGCQLPPMTLHTMYEGGVIGVPLKFVAGVKVMDPVEVFTEYVPSTVFSVVAVQSGADSPAAHSRTEVGSRVAVPVDV